MELPQELDRFARPNEKEIEIARNFCLARDGYFCKICKRSIQELIMQDNILRKLMKKPPRKRPIIVLNHKDGTMNFHIKNEMFGNVEIICCSCNRKYKPPQIDYNPNEIRTYASRKSHDAYSKYVVIVNNYLDKFHEGCLQQFLNKYSKVIKCSQDALMKYTKREIDTRWKLFNISDFNIECKYYFCDGVHLCFIDYIPEAVPTDHAVALEEEEDLL